MLFSQPSLFLYSLALPFPPHLLLFLPATRTSFHEKKNLILVFKSCENMREIKTITLYISKLIKKYLIVILIKSKSFINNHILPNAMNNNPSLDKRL